MTPSVLHDVIADKMHSIGDVGCIAGIGFATVNTLDSLRDKFPGWRCVCIDDHDVITAEIADKHGHIEFKDATARHPTTDEKIDVLLVDRLKPNTEWHSVYVNAAGMLSNNGILVSFNVLDKVHGEYIRQALNNLNFTELYNLGSVVVSGKREIRYGSYDISLDMDDYVGNADDLLSSDKVKVTGATGFNRFVNVPGDRKKTLSSYINNHLKSNFEWNFEYFQSGEPAGLHTDYVSIPNSWRPKTDNITTHDVHVVIGVIIPLGWNCAKQPFTINYDKVSYIPRKMLYRKGEMRYMDNDEVFSYRPLLEKDWIYDTEVLKYNPRTTQYHREYANLQVHSVYEWLIGTMLVFDTARWHSSSWFLSTDHLPQVSTEYKKSIIGFGSIDVDRWI